MKKIFFLITGMIVLQKGIAQYNTNLIVSPTPPSALTEWNNKKEVLTYLVLNQGAVGGNVKIKTEIKLSDGTVIGKTDLNTARTYVFNTASTILYAADVIPLENMIFTGKYKAALEKTGKLLSDNYTICVQLVRVPDFVPASELKCKDFYLASLQLPILMKPYNEEVLDEKIANQVLTFRWTPIVPKPSALIRYRLLVFEVLENQNPVQAMRSNAPILDKTVLGATQYIWMPQGIMNNPNSESGNQKLVNDSTKKKDVGGYVTLIKQRTINPANNTDSAAANTEWVKENRKTFVWTIQALDANGRPLGDGNINGDGVAEPILFHLANKNSLNARKAE
jgi:hypothetical protein